MTKIRSSFEQLQLITRGLHVRDSVFRALLRDHPDDAYDAVAANPFMLTEYEGIGFGIADQVARRLSFRPDFGPRIACGISTALTQEAARGGHVCLPRDTTATKASAILGAVVTRCQIEDMIQQMFRDNVLEFGDEFIYLRRSYYEERSIAEKLLELSLAPIRPMRAPDTSGLAEDQIKALARLRETAVGILTGPPGTGKTTTIKRYADAFPPGRVLLAAPTGKAAKRMTELTGHPASTIHRLLEAHVNEETGKFEFGRDEDFPLECDVLIVDETSMLDQPLAFSLLRAVEAGTRLLFVGDTDQLPPVGPGNVLRDMLASEAFEKQELVQIKRQDPGSIIRACHAIRQGRFLPPTEENLRCGQVFYRRYLERLNGDILLLSANTQDEVLNVIKALVTKDLPAAGYDPLRQVQVLAPFREKTEISCEAFNGVFQKHFAPEACGRLRFRVGDKVIQTRNDYNLGIVNGDVGYVREIRTVGLGHEYAVHFENPDRIVEIPTGDCDLQLAYCVTVHKYQGSELDVIVIPVHSAYPEWFLRRNWLYTAISRARKICLLVGNLGELNRIPKRTDCRRRYTRLAKVIKETSG